MNVLSSLLWVSLALSPSSKSSAVPVSDIKQDLPKLQQLYFDFHRNPELSFREQKTAQRLADELSQAGYEVTRNFGGHGVVGVLQNGKGPTVLIRADLDALPIREQTGLSYASKVEAVDIDGKSKPVMHACGHDVHMTVLVGTARRLAAQREQWSGTLVLIGQPAEERGGGAKAMLEAGLFKKFPRPDFNLALHVSPTLPAGTVGYTSGPAQATVDSMDIEVYGIGGHGAYPHTTKDPIVLSAQIINALQTVVSREINPLEPAVVTVGSIHGGHKHNIISDKVTMQLTLRSYSMEVRNHMIAAINRQVKNLGKAAGLPKQRLPKVSLNDVFVPVTTNNPALTARMVGVFQRVLGSKKVVEQPPVMGGEDFSRYGLEVPNIPSLMFRLGTVNPRKYKQHIRSKKPFPSLHTPFYTPDVIPTLRTGVQAMTAAALELLQQNKP